MSTKEQTCLTCSQATVNQGCKGCTQESKWQPRVMTIKNTEAIRHIFKGATKKPYKSQDFAPLERLMTSMITKQEVSEDGLS